MIILLRDTNGVFLWTKEFTYTHAYMHDNENQPIFHLLFNSLITPSNVSFGLCAVIIFPSLIE